MNKSISISHHEQYKTIVCEKCEYEFVLIAIIRGESNDEYASKYTLIKTDYCPFCGHKMRDAEQPLERIPDIQSGEEIWESMRCRKCGVVHNGECHAPRFS